MTERSKRVEIDAGDDLQALTFSGNGKNLLSGHFFDGVRLWQGERCVATMKADGVKCVAVSKDGRWIAAGTFWGKVYVWDARTYEQAFMHHKDNLTINAVEFSPDSARLVSASKNRTATVLDVNTRKQMHTLRHEGSVFAVKHSARIATSTEHRVRVWDSDDGSLLVDIEVEAATRCNRGLVWSNSNDHLFVVSKQVIRELDASTGSTVSECRVPDIDDSSCIALPKHEQFIAHAAKRRFTLRIRNTSTHAEISQIHHSEDICSIEISPDDLSFAIGGKDGKVVIDSLSRVIDSIPSSRLHPTLQEPEIQVEAAVFDAWQSDHLDGAETLLDAVIATSSGQKHHALACRALIRARLRRLVDALADAEQSINIRPSVAAYIAKSIAHVGNGHRHEAYRSCDVAIERFHSDHVTFLLLVKSVVVFIAGEHLDAISRVDDLIAAHPLVSVFYVVQAHMLLLHGNSLAECSNYEDAIQSYQRAQAQLRLYPTQSLFLISLIFGWKFDNLDIMIRRRMCEALYSAGRMTTTVESLLGLVHNFEREVYASGAVVEWLSDFTRRCLTIPGSGTVSSTVSSGSRNTDVSALHKSLLKEWAKATLVSRPWKDALASVVGECILPAFVVYQTICERLDAVKRTTDAAECLLEMTNQTSWEIDRQAEWIADFKRSLREKLEGYGDAAMKARRHEEAIVQYSTALSIDCKPLHSLLVKRSKACANTGLWKDALDDAVQAITLDHSSPSGYERKYVALRGAGCYGAAEVAFKTMLVKMSESPDAEMRDRSRRFVNPTETETAIRGAIQAVIHDSPPILINTYSGRLLDKFGQALSFESRPIFHELVSSTTTEIDHPRIRNEVEHYYRYATFSHKWKENEPSYDGVIHLVVHDLGQSPTHDKLQKFCEIAREAGLHWAWSDTCCINKSIPSVHQEALVSMFQWYQSSALTVVLLCDVPLHRLFDSVWNSRAWTFQEYHASKVVRFYNKDWTLYKNINVPNHKESPEIIAEMEEATGISAQALMALQPGLEDIREKLRLASTRQSTRVEDAAYSLLGIFSLSMSVEYGEGDKALGRLLVQLLASSGDTSILAWTGKPGGFNSCLPAKIAVFKQSATSHIPPAMTSDMEATIDGLRKAPLNRDSLTKLFDRLNKLPVPHFNGRRMKLPSIIFKLGPLSASGSGSERVFRAQTDVLGTVEIKTDEDLSRFRSLVLVHPWIDFLLDRQPVSSSVIETLPERQLPSGSIESVTEKSTEERCSTESPSPGPNVTSAGPKPGRSRLVTRLGLFNQRSATRLRDTARHMDALRALVRLKQPFGGLLLTPDSGNVAVYRRVATGTLITVRVVEEMTPMILDELISSVDVLDVL